MALQISTDAPVGALCAFSKSGTGTDQVSRFKYKAFGALATNTTQKRVPDLSKYYKVADVSPDYTAFLLSAFR